jgi:hypothetical protein|tara:strand:- start:480 stop:677 length:198 start_codon:yes stop_codon:yes gene_type:complete
LWEISLFGKVIPPGKPRGTGATAVFVVFGGKNPRHYVVTYPSSTPWIKLRMEHPWPSAIIEEDRS